MKILIRSTTLDGEPIPGSGESLQAADCLEVIELMRGQTPFTASRPPRDYMTEVLSGIEGGPIQPLPDDAAAAAAEFLTRLARHGLIEFLPDDKTSDPWPERFLEALETVPAHRMGRLWKFKKDEVDEWVKAGGAADKS